MRRRHACEACGARGVGAIAPTPAPGNPSAGQSARGTTLGSVPAEMNLMAIAETPTRTRALPPHASREAPVARPRGRSAAGPAGADIRHPGNAGAFLLTIWYSLQRWNLNRPERRAFVGLDNYVFLLTRDPAFLEAILQYCRLRRRRRVRVPRAGTALRRAGQPPLSRPRHRAHDADHAVPDHARGGGADLEEPAAESKLRRRRLGDQHRVAGKSRARAGSTNFPCSQSLPSSSGAGPRS